MLVPFSRDGPYTRGPLHNLKWNSGIAYLVPSIMPQEMGQSNEHSCINKNGTLEANVYSSIMPTTWIPLLLVVRMHKFKPTLRGFAVW